MAVEVPFISSPCLPHTHHISPCQSSLSSSKDSPGEELGQGQQIFQWLTVFQVLKIQVGAEYMASALLQPIVNQEGHRYLQDSLMNKQKP